VRGIHYPLAGAEDGDAAGLGGAFDRHELEEARMLEASMLGIPYEPQLPVRCVACEGVPRCPLWRWNGSPCSSCAGGGGPAEGQQVSCSGW